MKRVFIIINLLLACAICYAQINSSVHIYGRVPDSSDNRLYRIQVGAFLETQNAQRAFERLSAASLNPVYERHQNFTRVLISGIPAGEIQNYAERIYRIGFSEIIIRPDTGAVSGETLPVSTALQPSSSLREIGFRTIRTGETVSLANLVEDRNVTAFTSSTPSVVSADSGSNITGRAIGNAYVSINSNEYISIAVVPQEEFYIVPDTQVSLLPQESNSEDIRNIGEYRTEPTFRLSYRFNNRGERKGASGLNGGIDILARGNNYRWLGTTFYQGGWFYDLNGVKRVMVNGFQKDAANGVELTINPEFVYEKGTPYLQLRHKLYNPNNFSVSGQRFGASADVMIHRNDNASLILTSYGAYMTDSITNPTFNLMLVCLEGNAITPVDTLWLGNYGDGNHLHYIYTDSRSNIHRQDSAIGFSYQDINLAPRETKEFIIRFTLARHEELKR